MGAKNRNKVAEVLSSLDPRGYDRVDLAFGYSFLVVIAGAVMLFLTTSFWVSLASIVVMTLAFVSMLLCVGLEDIFKDKKELEEVRSDDGGGEREADTFEGGDTFGSQSDPVGEADTAESAEFIRNSIIEGDGSEIQTEETAEETEE